MGSHDCSLKRPASVLTVSNAECQCCQANSKTNLNQFSEFLCRFQKGKTEINENACKLKNTPTSSYAHRPFADQKSDPEAAKNAVVYLKKHQSVFEKIFKLHDENATLTYTVLIGKLVKLMPECRYELNMSREDKLAIAQFFYGELCLQMVFEPYQTSRSDPVADLEERCAKKMFYVLKLNLS